MAIEAAYIVPHPPLILPAIGKGEERRIQNTIEACQEITDEIIDMAPDTVVLISPHAEFRRERFLVPKGKEAEGDFAMFGHPRPTYRVPYDNDFARIIIDEADGLAEAKGYGKVPLDHGALVPLSFFGDHLERLNIVLVAPSASSLARHAAFGDVLRRAAEKDKSRVVLVASGDLSHRLLDEGPYGYAKEGPRFDDLVCDIIERSRPEEFLQIERDLAERAGECGLRPFAMLAGALRETRVQGRLLSYEGPFGVGYAVASFHPVAR